MKPWLWIPPQLAHDLSQPFLKTVGSFIPPRAYHWQPLNWRGLHFNNRLGLAGGVDKTGAQVRGWWSFGAGFIEVGTVTPLAQEPNPPPIMDRNFSERALWNKMGFPNAGAKALRNQLAKLAFPHYTPIFVNVGKNRQTPNESAAEDYLKSMRVLNTQADAFVINISSPNTKGLRELQSEANFREFLQSILRDRDARAGRPVLLKLSPDLRPDELVSLLRTSADSGIDGWILANTTLARAPGLNFPAEGGVSGAPLAEISKRTLKTAVEFLGQERSGRLLISVGGVLTPNDVRERLEMGADLVQVYTALIFSGPNFFRSVAKQNR